MSWLRVIKGFDFLPLSAKAVTFFVSSEKPGPKASIAATCAFASKVVFANRAFNFACFTAKLPPAASIASICVSRAPGPPNALLNLSNAGPPVFSISIKALTTFAPKNANLLPSSSASAASFISLISCLSL